MTNRLIPALMLVAACLAGPAGAQTSLADAYKPHKPATASHATGGGFATIKPLTPQKPFGGGETFKPFEGQHIGSSRGGLDPYPHANRPSRSGAQHLFGAATEDRD